MLVVSGPPTLTFFFVFFLGGNGNSSLCVKFVPWNKECGDCWSHISGVPFKDTLGALLPSTVPPPPPLMSLVEPSYLKEVISGDACPFTAQERSRGSETGRLVSLLLLLFVSYFTSEATTVTFKS